MSVEERHHVRVSGDPAGRPMVLAHGFGCDQSMWRSVAPAFEHDHRVVLSTTWAPVAPTCPPRTRSGTRPWTGTRTTS